MKLNIHPTLVYRVPRFSYHDDLKDCWPELKLCIADSSKDFYELIKAVEFSDLDKLPQSIKDTIWKYFNRSRFRATPFGSFAAIGLTRLSPDAELPLKLAPSQTLHRFVEWEFKGRVKGFTNLRNDTELYLFANSTYYPLMDSIRYISGKDAEFEVMEIERNETILDLLQSCRQPIKVSAILEQFAPVLDQDTVFALLKHLVDIQLLLTSNAPNIIGEDYFERLSLSGDNHGHQYIIATRETESGAPPHKLFRHVNDLISLLHRLAPQKKDSTLSRFAEKFSRRFDQREVPLMIALDPETGLGYDDLEQPATADDFIGSLGLYTNKASPSKELSSALLKQLFKHAAYFQSHIDLEDLTVESSEPTNHLPNSLSMLFSIAEDRIIIDTIGGATANALLGRFTLANNSVHSFTKEIVSMEASANPDVLFFDIAYVSEPHVDNINRRKTIYNYQLSIMSYDTSHDPLTLDDLFVSVRNGKVILRSGKLNKRVIPRLSTAYNYQRSDLPVFRMLCDLQAQDLCTNLSLRLHEFIPELDYYPELRFRNIIVSTRSWRIRQADFKHAGKSFAAWLSDLELSRYVRSGAGDQTLCFDTTNRKDQFMLEVLLNKQNLMLLEEVKLSKQPVIQRDGKLYSGQFLMTITHQQKIYDSTIKKSRVADENVQQYFPLGQQWLYFQIFCHPFRADNLLNEVLFKYLRAHKRHIGSWFFIRYNEGGDHLRLRIKIKQAKDLSPLISGLSAALDSAMKSGIVQDMQMRIYQREIERYGLEHIDNVEEHFHEDSKFIISSLTQYSTYSRYSICAALLYSIDTQGLIPIPLAQYVDTILQSFTKEFNLNSEQYKILNTGFKDYYSQAFRLTIKQKKAWSELEQSFTSVLRTCLPTSRSKMLGDLIHMHFNRHFSSDQRGHEMAFYYFMDKEIKRSIHLHKSTPNHA